MSKILKRPMFRKGGSINEGIVSMAQPRKNYQGGTEYEDIIKMFPEKEKSIREGAARAKLMSAFAGSGRSQGDRVSDLLIQGGLNLMSARPRGNIFATAAESFKEPTSQFLKEKQAENAFQRQVNLGGITGAISAEDAERLAQIKAQREYAKDKLLSDERRSLEIQKNLTKTYGPRFNRDGIEVVGEILDGQSISKMTKTFVELEKKRVVGPGGKPLVGASVSRAPIVDGQVINEEYLDTKTKQPLSNLYQPGKFYVNHDGDIYLYQGQNKFKKIYGAEGQ
jgi:hypothetical protein